ncbi:MAG: hypothetical protein IK106_08890 [Clostridiales bacterium]|nr:hypothetical protein [Clostridiales bacterium]MBR6254817.1 hypothetical protein [Clostridiales bacterium]
MDATKSITLKQYRILLSFALLLIFTTSTVPVFCSAFVQIMLFCLINHVVFSHVSNRRIAWGIFLSLAALIGEGVFLLTPYLPQCFSSDAFYLLPASTFLFLCMPMFDYYKEDRHLSLKEMGSGFSFYVFAGFFISTVRELFGNTKFFGIDVPVLSRWKIRFFGHTAGSAMLVLGILIFFCWWKNLDEEDEDYVLDTSERRSKIYQPLSAGTAKRFIVLSLCILLYDLLFSVFGILAIYYAPEYILKPAHIVIMSSVLAIILLTLLIKGFRLSETVDTYFFVPLLSVITTSIPLIFFSGYLDTHFKEFSLSGIAWWVALMVGVWIFTTIVIAYTRSIHGRLLFGRQPKYFEGVPLIVLHVLLAMIVFTPWTQILAKL